MPQATNNQGGLSIAAMFPRACKRRTKAEVAMLEALLAQEAEVRYRELAAPIIAAISIQSPPRATPEQNMSLMSIQEQVLREIYDPLMAEEADLEDQADRGAMN